MNKRLISGLVLLLSLGTASAESGAVPLASYTAQFQQRPKEQVLDGVVEAVQRATISAQISGRITEVNVDVDDFVEKNSIIARIRDKEFKARLSQVEAALKSANAQAKEAQLEYQRTADLVSKKLVAESQFDQAKARLKSAEAQVNAAEAQVTETKEQLANTVIRAPYSGIVTERHIEVGEMASPGKAIMSGLSMDKLRVTVQVPQTFINAIRDHKQARVILEDGRVLPGGKITIFPIADAIHHTFRVRLDLPENTEQLFPGMLVKAAFTVAQEHALLIPASALFHRSEVSAVYVIDDKGKVQMRQVRPGSAYGDMIEILSGIDAGETLALDPVQAGVQLKAQTGGGTK